MDQKLRARYAEGGRGLQPLAASSLLYSPPRRGGPEVAATIYHEVHDARGERLTKNG